MWGQLLTSLQTLDLNSNELTSTLPAGKAWLQDLQLLANCGKSAFIGTVHWVSVKLDRDRLTIGYNSAIQEL